MYLVRHLLAISFITKLNLYLIHIKLVTFLPLTECSCLRHFSLIATFYLHMI